MTDYTAKAIVEAMETMTTKEKCEYISVMLDEMRTEARYWKSSYDDLEKSITELGKEIGMGFEEDFSCDCHTAY